MKREFLNLLYLKKGGNIINPIISFVIITLLCTLTGIIHELGHLFFVKVFGGKVTKFCIGFGRDIIKIGVIRIRIFFILGGSVHSKDWRKHTLFSKIFFIMGGILFNLITIITLKLLMGFTSTKIYYYLSILYEYNLYFIVFNLLPITVFNINLDGKQLYELIRYKKSNLYNDKSINDF